MKKKNLLTIFCIVSGLLLGAAFSYWRYRSGLTNIFNTRKQRSYRLLEQMDGAYRKGEDYKAWETILTSNFRKDRQLSFVALFNAGRRALYFQTRLDESSTTEAMNLINHELIFKKDAALFRDPVERDGFSFRVPLSREETGSLLLLYSALPYRDSRAAALRTFFIIAFLVVLVSLTVPLLTKKRTRKRTRHSRSKHAAVPLLQHSNTRSKNDFRLDPEPATSNSLYKEAAARHSFEDLMAFIADTVSASLQADNLELVVEGTHSTSALREKPMVRVIDEVPFRRLLEAATRENFLHQHRVLVPLQTNGTGFALLRLERDHQRARFSEYEVEQAFRLAEQLSLPIYNFILYEMAVSDGLTGLYTRRHFNQRLSEELERSRRYKTPLSLVMMDLDHFKHVNDRHGHQAGDQVLQETCRLLKDSIRKTDYAFRYGGEEIAIIMPQTSLHYTADVMEMLRSSLEEHCFRLDDGNSLRLTASFGIAWYSGSGGCDDGKLIGEADRALYFSKKNGRNMVSRSETTEKNTMHNYDRMHHLFSEYPGDTTGTAVPQRSLVS